MDSPEPLLRRHISIGNFGTDDKPNWRITIDGLFCGKGESERELQHSCQILRNNPEMAECQHARYKAMTVTSPAYHITELWRPLSTGHLTFFGTNELYMSLGAVYHAPISSPLDQGNRGYRVLGAEMICTWTEWVAGKSKEYGL